MSIQSLTLNQFRNLANSNLNFSPSLNVIIGDNGSGKSSLLESIFFLGHGKSFRTAKIEQLIQTEQANFVVSAKDDLNHQLGVKRGRQGDIQIRINGDSKYRLSDLAKHVAVQVITPETFRLFFGGPKERRKFVDLGLFHVEHSYVNLWREFKKILVQRNACLKQRIGGQQLSYYNQLFCQQSETIAKARQHYVEQLAEELNKWLEIIMPVLADNISLHYQRGWSSSRSLSDLLNDNYERELKYGYSLFGAHKFDLQFSYNKQPVEQILSRGQQKLFLMALTIAQANLIYQSQKIAPIILIDDIGAELDKHSRTVLAEAIAQLHCQLFITAIEQDALDAMLPQQHNYKMFHVKHGVVTEITQGEKT
ncbi:DNA replication/repair protein RecF [Thalassotalea ponticola]|uniref:DNA replication/repair protein RecF n=1 Tax=Thalassotalea ponticola TaxID=1523392 RepID=UPI0025B53ADC|nr:DNA replication/repair protein RecF [Thalassotalea ponticola]MDN3653061.1 DNA replication/repair protein RecF [Thalassotalea ponticola]